MRRWHKVLAASSVALAVLVPSGVALAATNSNTPGTGAAVTRTCTGDQQMLRLRDGTGWRHTTTAGDTVTVSPGQGYQHRYMSGPQDGSGPQANPALNGTGYQWRNGW